MKNNSYKYMGLLKNLNKKFVLTAVLAAVLSGPYIFQVSSKDFGLMEMSSDAEPTEQGYDAVKALALTALKAKHPELGDIKEIPADLTKITDPSALEFATKAKEMRIALDKTRVVREIKKATDAAAAAEKTRKDEEVAAEKKAKDDAADKKKKDCDDKDKSATEKRECKDEAKVAEKLKKQEENEEKFIEKYEQANQKCIDKARTKDSNEELELKCHSEGFAAALNKFKKKKDGELSLGFVNEQFKDIIGNDLFKMLFSENAEDVEKANIIMSNLFGGKIPAQYNSLKRLVMDEVRRKANTETTKVVAEFKKANKYAKNSTEYFAQYAVATAAQDEFGAKLFSHGAAMYNPMYRVGDTDGLSYYKTSYLGNNERIQKALLAASLGTVGGEAGAAARNAATRNGLSTTTEARVGADGKMTHTGGVSYVLQSPGTAEHISIGTPSSSHVGKIRQGIRVTQ